MRAPIEGLKDRKFVLLSPHTIERAGIAGRASARKRAAIDLVTAINPAITGNLDKLLITQAEFGKTPLAWLRDISEVLSTSNIGALLERLRYVREIGIRPTVTDTISAFRFGQFAREANVAPAFLLQDYSDNRRHATLAATVIELEGKLADAPLRMFDRLVGSLFSLDDGGRNVAIRRRPISVSKLMRLFGATIAALDMAEETGGDPLALVDELAGWHNLIAAKPHVDALAQLAQDDILVMAAARHSTLRRFSPTFLKLSPFMGQEVARRSSMLSKSCERLTGAKPANCRNLFPSRSRAGRGSA